MKRGFAARRGTGASLHGERSECFTFADGKRYIAGFAIIYRCCA